MQKPPRLRAASRLSTEADGEISILIITRKSSETPTLASLNQCRKWRMPVKTMAMPSLSAAAMTSWSLTLPPG